MPDCAYAHFILIHRVTMYSSYTVSLRDWALTEHETTTHRQLCRPQDVSVRKKYPGLCLCKMARNIYRVDQPYTKGNVDNPSSRIKH